MKDRLEQTGLEAWFPMALQLVSAALLLVNALQWESPMRAAVWRAQRSRVHTELAQGLC